jgi:very-short-patch-repair endonuclease
MAADFSKRARGTSANAHASAVSFDEVVARQAGVVSLAQAVAHGYSAGRAHRRVREGSWRRLHPGVFLVGGHRLTDEARVRAAWLWAAELDVAQSEAAGSGAAQLRAARQVVPEAAGPDGAAPGAAISTVAVAGSAAAHWHGMVGRAPAVVDVTVPRRAKPRARPGVRIHRRDLACADVITLRGLRVAGKGLATLETALVLPDGPAFLDRALQKHLRFPELYAAYCRGLGRVGSAEMGRLLAAAADRADSAAERLVVKHLRAAGIGGWLLGYPFGLYLIDLAFPEAKLAVEIDGWAWHVDQDRFVNDRRKQNALVRAGWTVLRFTWHDLTSAPHSVVAQIAAALARAA